MPADVLNPGGGSGSGVTLTASRAVVSDGSGALAAATTTAVEIGYVSGVTSAIQTQLDAKIAKTLTTTTGDIIYASSANTPARLAIGTNGYVLTVSGGVPVWAAAAGGLTYITEALATSSPNNTVNAVSLTVSTGASNTDLALVSKGNGALLAVVADGTSTGGNKRGINSVDWQRARTTAAQVASGNNSVIGGGLNNTASGTYTVVVGGLTNTASGDYSVAGGYNNTASNIYAIALGNGNNVSGSGAVALGYSNTVSANNSFALGSTNSVSSGAFGALGLQNSAANTASLAMGYYGGSKQSNDLAFGFYNLYIQAAGFSQLRVAQLNKRTTNATPTLLEQYAGGTAYATVPSYSAHCFTCWVVGRSNATGAEVAAYRFEGLVYRQNAASTTVLAGASAPTFTSETTGSMDCALAADTTNGGVTVTVTGVASKTIDWQAVFLFTEINGTS